MYLRIGTLQTLAERYHFIIFNSINKLYVKSKYYIKQQHNKNNFDVGN